MGNDFLSSILPPDNIPVQNVPIPAVDQMQSIPSMGPQPTQMPPEAQHVNDVIGQYLQNQQQNQPNSMLQQILSNRMQPDLSDAATAGLRETQSYASPQGFRPYSPEQVMAEKNAYQLAPYTSMLDIGNKQAELQKNQVGAQYAEPEAQADVRLKNAQAQMATGMFGGMAGGAGGTGAAGGPHGDEFLQTLPGPFATTIKAIAEGRAPYPSGFALKTPIGQQMVAAISQYDPSFDAVNYQARQKTRQSFTSGADANNIAALNTAMAHLGTLSDSYGALGNTDYPMVNQAVNYAGNQLGSQSIQTNTANVSTDAQAVAHELAKVFRSTGMSEGEINQWQDKISTSSSPAQSKAVIGSALDLIDGRLSALGEKYNQGMGTTKQGIELLSPQAQQAYNKLRGNNSPQGQQPQQATGNSGVPEGQTATNPQTGQKIVFKNGQWSPL